MSFEPTPEILDRITERLRAAEPTLEAVVLCGSFVRGEGDRYSDIDVMAVTRGDPVRAYRAWFERGPEGRLIHVSVGAESLEDFTEDEEAEPARWALGFPVEDAMRLVWASPRGRKALGEDPTEHLPAGPPELEDFVEFHMKMRRAAASGDRLRLRWAARMLAEYSAGLVLPFNPQVAVRSPAEALAAALALPDTPAHYREDFETCWGLAPAPDEAVIAAAERMTREALAWLRERLAGEVFADDDIRAALLEGTLEAYAFG